MGTEDVAHADLVGGGQTNLHSHAGGGGGPEMDAGTHTIVVSKAWEAETFHITFTNPPAVTVTLQGVAGGKKSGHNAVTTTGFDISAEAIGDCDWIAVEKGT